MADSSSEKEGARARLYRDLEEQRERRKAERAECYKMIEEAKGMYCGTEHFVILHALRVLLKHHEPLGVEDE